MKEKCTYTRRRCGRGYSYYDSAGNRVRCKKLKKRFKSLAIPPLWQDVEISNNPDTKIQASGRDARNKKQYIYHSRFEEQQQRKKFEHVAEFAFHLPTLRQHCYEQLRDFKPTKKKVIALVLLILDQTGVRVGNQQHTQANNTFGLTTLRRRHLVRQNGSLIFAFVGKGGKSRTVDLDDDLLIKHLISCAELPGHELFRYKTKSSKWTTLSSDEVNEHIQQLIGEKFTAKYFRTWLACRKACESFKENASEVLQSKQTLPESSKERKKLLNHVLEDVADALGNTPKMACDYYVHPLIKENIEHQPDNFYQQLNTEKCDVESQLLRLMKNMVR